MEVSVSFSRLVPYFAIVLIVLIVPVYGQTSSPCTPTMLTSFAPCINFVTNSSANGTLPTPTPACCSSLRSLASNSTGCMCLIANGNVPFQMPVNRTLAISLPTACNMPGVPLQCLASAAPAPAPGHATLAPAASPGAASSPSPKASAVPNPVSPALSPEADTTPELTPTSPTVESEAPSTNPGSRPSVTPSAATPSHNISPSLLLAMLGAIVFKHC